VRPGFFLEAQSCPLIIDKSSAAKIRGPAVIVAKSLRKALIGDELKMGSVGLALLGLVLGAAGAEFLRAKKPELVEKIEDSAKRFVESLNSLESADGEAKEK